MYRVMSRTISHQGAGLGEWASLIAGCASDIVFLLDLKSERFLS
jgi:hypothetical protein